MVLPPLAVEAADFLASHLYVTSGPVPVAGAAEQRAYEALAAGDIDGAVATLEAIEGLAGEAKVALDLLRAVTGQEPFVAQARQAQIARTVEVN